MVIRWLGGTVRDDRDPGGGAGQVRDFHLDTETIGIAFEVTRHTDGEEESALDTVDKLDWIFDEYLAGAGRFAIAERLTRDGIPSPSAHDRARNRHRTGSGWSKSAVRAILMNPRYTGKQVWNRQRRDESALMDVDDVTPATEPG